MALSIMLPPSTLPVSAASDGDRTLYFHHTHTGLTESFTFRRNGQYDTKVLGELNIFLADWRTKEPTKMDPALFDLIWQIYHEVGATQPINIVSAYRSPETNAMLHARSSAVAEHSQHMLGRAMDIFIPGVPLAKLRATAMHYQVGGVGYYPTSGSPFVHVDTGSVRAWPRMTTAQLKKVFPDGKTLHLPLDGKPLSSAGRQFAMAQWSKCHMVPCSGASAPRQDAGATIQLASFDPTQRNVPTFAVTAPVPVMRSAALVTPLTAPINPFGNPSEELAPMPVTRSPAMMLARLGKGETALAALSEIDAPVPQARVLMTPADSQMMTAYASPTDAGAQKALEMIINRETTASLTPHAGNPEIRTASIDKSRPDNVFAGMFDLTWSAVSRAGAPRPMVAALAGLAESRKPINSLSTHDVEFVAPDMDHVTETMLMPEAMDSINYAEFYEPEGYLDRGAELGPMANRVGLEMTATPDLQYDQFIRRAPLLVASR